MEAKDPMQQYLDIHKNIYELCMFFKQNRFEGDLPNFVLTVNPDPRNSAYGWCWEGVWAEGDSGKQYCEINICSQYISRPFDQVAATVLHELVHLYARHKKIQDTAKNGKYHNRKYKELAERFGLKVKNLGSYRGWAKTSLTEESLALLEQFGNRNIQLLCDRRSERKKTAVKKPPAPTKTYTCSCGQTVRSKKELDLICSKCHGRLEPVRK